MVARIMRRGTTVTLRNSSGARKIWPAATALDDEERIKIRDKACLIRLEIWDSLPEAVKKDPKCGYAKKATDYDKNKKSKGG
jgi:hypothetical protein